MSSLRLLLRHDAAPKLGFSFNLGEVSTLHVADAQLNWVQKSD
jgi:hypothetical protein